MIFNVLGLLMFMWYTAIRWTMLGNQLGKITKTSFELNWWFAPINFLTAILSIIFILITLFTLDKSFMLWLFWVGTFLFCRNIYYTVEDIIDYLQYPSKQQAFYILLDILMVIYVALWIVKYKGG